MRSKALFPYFGSKGQLAEWITTLLPPHEVYVEPFAGSGAVLLAKDAATVEVLNDLDGDIVAFFRALRDDPERLERALRLTPYARDEYRACRLDVDVDDFERARRFWVRATQSFSGVIPKGVRTNWRRSRDVDHPNQTQRRLDRMHDVAARLATVYIDNDDALNVIARFDGPDTVFYLDPPYLGSTRRADSASYGVDMLGAGEHVDMAHLLNNVKGAVLVSGYHSSLYDDLFAGWHTIERRVMASAGKREERVEVVWSNRPLPAAAQAA